MTESVGEITGIFFGVLSESDVLNMSVVEVTSSKKVGPNSIYDPKMGPVDNNNCVTCGQDAISCPGHFGHIVLSEPIVHPLYTKKVISILRCVCGDCKRLLLSRDHLAIKGCTDRNKSPVTRFNMVKKLMMKIDICTWCSTPQPSFKSNTVENTISMTYEDTDNDKQKVSIDISAQEILDIFKEISDEDVRLLGMNPKLTRPSSLIITALPVLPPPGRPFVRAAGNMCDDDLSNQYVEIVKVNNKLKQAGTEGAAEGSRRLKLLQTLKFRIATTFNNSAGRAKHTTNGRPVKCIKTRISGKDGQMRGNIMGRRANQTARTVIGPDTALKNGEMVVPEEVARILTIPNIVSDRTRDNLTKIVNDGHARFIVRKKEGREIRINLDHARVDKGTRLELGDEIIPYKKKEHTRGCFAFKIGDDSPESHDRVCNGLRKGDAVFRNGSQLENVRFRKKRIINLQNGDVVERCLRDGDFVVLNRQPTLHKASMMAFKTFVRKGKTFRFNLACTKAFNADFDGDEMNIHCPQTQEARAEIQFLSTVQSNLITGQSSKMNIVIVQDGVLGSYLMTKKLSRKLTKGQFFNALMRVSNIDRCLQRMHEIQTTLDKVGDRTSTTLLSGRGLVSMILPSDFWYKKKNGKEDGEPWLIIEDGVILQGCLSKNSIGSSHGCIPHYLHNEYSPKKCLDFLDDLQFITNAYLLITSFSIGFRDCLPSNNDGMVKNTISRCFMEADAIERGTRNVAVKESRINAALGKAKDIGLRIAKDNLKADNSFISTVMGGSKGDFFNIAQITGLLGQQNISGKRIPLFLNNETRSIPHYPKNKEDYTMEQKYESRGFISSSFIKGLNPREFFFHACSGREGMSDTAVGTAVSGYIQRRIVKLQEDIRIQYDGTVRDETSRIFQLKYGDHGMDPEKTIKSKGTMWFTDINRVAEKLNRKK